MTTIVKTLSDEKTCFFQNGLNTAENQLYKAYMFFLFQGCHNKKCLKKKTKNFLTLFFINTIHQSWIQHCLSGRCTLFIYRRYQSIFVTTERKYSDFFDFSDYPYTYFLPIQFWWITVFLLFPALQITFFLKIWDSVFVIFNTNVSL